MASPSIRIASSGASQVGGGEGKGHGKDGFENQDSFFSNLGQGIFGVFDGHGRAGYKAANLVCDTVKDLTTREILAIEGESIAAKMTKLFKEIDEVLSGEIAHTSLAGGTTASLLLVDRVTGAATVAHVGDSEVWYFDGSSTYSPHIDPVSALGLSDGHQFTADHSVLSLTEYSRMSTIPGLPPPKIQFDPLDPSSQAGRDAFVQIDGVTQINPEGGYKVCTAGGEHAAYIFGPAGERLAMTRSLGDFNMKKCGHLTAVPSVISTPPIPDGISRTFVIASDGLWDVLTPADVKQILSDPFNATASTAEEALMLAARAKSIQYFGMGGDDITVIVVKVWKEVPERL
jgi:serine/threonine protein phosphatase PrpC